MRSRGTLAAFAAYGFWGLSPLYWRLLDSIPAPEQLAHRVLWSVPLIVVVSWLNRGLGTLRGLGPRAWARLTTGGLLLVLNWGVFVWAVTVDRVVEASLGYFMTPLVSVALGVVVLGERLRRVQWLSVGLALAGVVYLTVRFGSLPWVALTLALSFGAYGLFQKWHGGIGPWASLGAEMAWAWPLAAAAVLVWGVTGRGAFVVDPGATTLLLLTGPVTVLPLLWFGVGARRLPLTALGAIQYLNPTMQLAIGVWVFGEAMPPERLFGFGLVWAAIALYLWDLVRGGAPSPGGALARWEDATPGRTSGRFATADLEDLRDPGGDRPVEEACHAEGVVGGGVDASGPMEAHRAHPTHEERAESPDVEGGVG